MRNLFKVAEQTSWQVFGKVITSLSTFISISLIARNYSKDEVGIYTLATTYLTMFFIITDLGLNADAITRFNSDKSEANKLLNARLYFSLFLIILSILLSFVLPLGSDLFKFAVLAGSVSILGNGIFTSTNLVFQHNLRYDRSIIASSIGALIMVFVVYLMVQMKFPVHLLVIALGLGWIIDAILAIILVKRFYHFRLTPPDFNYFINILKRVWPISLTLILNVVYFRFDGFILAATRNLADVGIYNLSFTLFQAALVVPTFIMNSYYPIILRELNNKVAVYKQLMSAFLIMIGISLLGVFLTFLLSEPIINLMGGGRFPESVGSLNILAISFPAFFGSALLMWVFVSFKKYKELLYIYTLGLIVNLVLNILFTPTYSYIASSWITVGGEYFILLLQLFMLILAKNRRI